MVVRVKPGKAEATAIGDVNVANGRGAGADVFPYAEGLKDSPGTFRQRDGPRRLPASALGSRVDERRAHAAAGERQRARNADKAASGDDDIESIFVEGVFHLDALPTSASTSSICFGAALVSTCGLPWVTRTSSSMRTPIFHHFFGTLLSPPEM